MTGRRIGIIGAGLMGHGIAQAFAEAGHRVDVLEPDPTRRAGITDRIRRNLEELGRDTGAAGRVHACATMEEAAAEADVVIEAVPEDLDLKRRVFLAMEAVAPPHALLASNTSVIPITQIVEPLRNKSRAMGTHWWNPPHLIPLVEVVQTPDTAETAIATMIALLTAIGKTPVHVRKDVPGFIGNRLQHALWREAIALVQNGVCDAETVDAVVKASFGRRLAVLGPLENADLVGTDLTLAVHGYLLGDLDRSAEPQPLLRELVASGRLGMKTGAGFRTWTEAQTVETHSRLAAHLRRLDNPAGG
ncbi:3-hydroxyacyl-CoA dehydrogenase family protein [Azospirillum sp. RWY-5-1]|uniref:3-hydroxyacyl-CoA dehydrogenase family protein n=1 Tax=Azospirillum oleiclasticum TaxID=2735135 RepID=A0ABX2T6L2_9PROT|nr:3-hydroxyacyl-CoA dehydrogenase family protein [Azospirillum oleiclasticum]NYZ12807.1 3-hydroxyacyl-CoA dehydrogenase family protein [Azospirillum oleiclasticum]NYZ19967.1 3-hydroxyacyl-CoA dehydrogenase family protein [Azospirillum oleiclasticum]